MILGYENPIRNQEDHLIGPALGVSLSLCAELYCGIKKDGLNEDVLVECIKFVYRNYKDLGFTEIKEAFDMCANNKFDNVNMRAYYGQFNISMLGDILSAYKKERNQIINKVLDLHQKNHTGESFWDERDHKNFLARQEVVKEFKEEIERVKSGKERKYKTFHDIRVHWPKILLDNGIIHLPDSRKSQLWIEAKNEVIKETKKIATDYNNIYDAKGAKQILKSFENPENQSLKQKAEVIYGKLFVWEFLK